MADPLRHRQTKGAATDMVTIAASLNILLGGEGTGTATIGLGEGLFPFRPRIRTGGHAQPPSDAVRLGLGNAGRRRDRRACHRAPECSRRPSEPKVRCPPKSVPSWR